MKIGFIGAGKVGTTLAKAFVERGLTVTGFFSRTPDSAIFSAEFTKTKAFDRLASLVAESDTIVLTVPDDAIKLMIKSLETLPLKCKTICHTSGVYSIDEILPHRERLGACGIGLHPLYPIHDKVSVWHTIHEATFTLEGDREPVTTWQHTLTNLGFTVKTIEPQHKAAYHAAASIACNFTCALLEQSLRLMAKSGFSEREALDALRPLLEANLAHLLASGPQTALTGPIERNDIGTVTKHLHALATDLERRRYAVMGLSVVDIAKRRHPTTNYSQLIELLESFL